MVGIFLFKSLFEAPIDLKAFISPLCWAMQHEEGEEIKRIRGFYAHIRRKLQENTELGRLRSLREKRGIR